MKNMICGIVAVAGIASGANAATGLESMVSTDGGATWSLLATVTPGTSVTVGVFGVMDAANYAFASAVFRADITTADGTDGVAIGSYNGTANAGFGFGTVTTKVFTTGTGYRIDAASDTSNSSNAGINPFQKNVSTGGTPITSNPVLLYSYSVTAGSSLHTILVGESQIKGGKVGVWGTSGDSNVTQVTADTTGGATIVVTPSPASLALVGLGGLVAGRRRR